MKLTKRLIALSLVMLMLFAGCTPADTDEPSTDNPDTPSTDDPATTPDTGDDTDVDTSTLNVILSSEPPNADPHNNTRLSSWAVQEEVFDKLVTKDEAGNILPDLALEWEQIDDVTTRFTIRDDVTFHDGSALTAEDVAFSLQRACTSAGSQTFFIQFDPDNIKVVDTYVVDVATKQPFAAVLNYLASARGAILPKAVVESVGDEAFARAPVGSGPFVVESWTVGDKIVLQRNESYWGAQPAYDTLEFRFVTEASNRAIELETGGADIVYDIVPNDAARLAETDGVEIVSGPAFKFVYVSFNMSDDTLSNEKLREALVTAVDIPSLVAAVYGSDTQVADTYMSPNIMMHASMPAKTYDPALAQQLLAEAGYANGLELTIKLGEDAVSSTIAEIIQGMWAEIGVTTNIEPMEQATYLEQANAGEVQVAIATTNAVSGDPDNAMMIWRSTAVNAIQPNDTTIDEYLDRGAAEFDYDTRAGIYEELQQYVWEKNYCIPLCFPNVVYGIGDNIEGFYPHPGNTPDLANIVIN